MCTWMYAACDALRTNTKAKLLCSGSGSGCTKLATGTVRRRIIMLMIMVQCTKWWYPRVTVFCCCWYGSEVFTFLGVCAVRRR